MLYQGNETEEKVFKKRKVFKEDLKELTEVEWWTKTGKWKEKKKEFQTHKKRLKSTLFIMTKYNM